MPGLVSLIPSRPMFSSQVLSLQCMKTWRRFNLFFGCFLLSGHFFFPMFCVNRWALFYAVEYIFHDCFELLNITRMFFSKGWTWLTRFHCKVSVSLHVDSYAVPLYSNYCLQACLFFSKGLCTPSPFFFLPKLTHIKKINSVPCYVNHVCTLTPKLSSDIISFRTCSIFCVFPHFSRSFRGLFEYFETP